MQVKEPNGNIDMFTCSLNDSSDLKMDEMVGPDVLAVVRPPEFNYLIYFAQVFSFTRGIWKVLSMAS